MPAQLTGYRTIIAMRILSVLLLALFLSACSSPDKSLDEKNTPIVSVDPIFSKTIAPIIITNPVDSIDLLVGQNLVFRTFPDADLTSSTLSVTNGDSTIVLLKNGETFETFTTAPGLTALSEGSVTVTLTNGEVVQVYSITIKLPVVDSNPPIESTNPPLGSNNDPGIVIEAPNDSVDMPIKDNFFDAEAKQTSIFAQKIIGMKFLDAKLLLERSNISVRIGEEDGMVFALTMDYNPSRITLSIVSGTITSASVG
jgi:hypothetical protein